MLFNSMDFLIFFPIVIAVYFIIPRKARYIWLLVCSYYFYMNWNPKYALLMLLSTLITYLSGLLMEHASKKSHKKVILAGSLISNLGILVLYKYLTFLFTNISAVLGLFHVSVQIPSIDLLLPVGISFYTFQALSYSMDVYREEIKPEHNFLKYALFVSFFPQLVAGPIERSSNLISQVCNVDKLNLWNFERVKQGLLLMMWGYFQKLIIADRAAIYVDRIYNSYTDYGFLELLFATILFAFQIYCDFNGYTCIARGASKVLGVNLMLNFKQPYLASSIKDFWRRWHISLTSWFTDYLYIPLGGNRKGRLRKYLNIMIIFSVSGLWHGASWHYIIWGFLHGVFQIGQDIKNPFRRFPKVIQIMITFLLVDFAWLFFRADSAKNALLILRQMTMRLSNGFSFLSGQEQINDLGILLVALLLLLVIDLLHEKNISLITILNRQNIFVRYIIYCVSFWGILMFGIFGPQYDASNFIYFQF